MWRYCWNVYTILALNRWAKCCQLVAKFMLQQSERHHPSRGALKHHAWLHLSQVIYYYQTIKWPKILGKCHKSRWGNPDWNLVTLNVWNGTDFAAKGAASIRTLHTCAMIQVAAVVRRRRRPNLFTRPLVLIASPTRPFLPNALR